MIEKSFKQQAKDMQWQLSGARRRLVSTEPRPPACGLSSLAFPGMPTGAAKNETAVPGLTHSRTHVFRVPSWSEVLMSAPQRWELCWLPLANSAKPSWQQKEKNKGEIYYWDSWVAQDMEEFRHGWVQGHFDDVMGCSFPSVSWFCSVSCPPWMWVSFLGSTWCQNGCRQHQTYILPSPSPFLKTPQTSCHWFWWAHMLSFEQSWWWLDGPDASHTFCPRDGGPGSSPWSHKGWEWWGEPWRKMGCSQKQWEWTLGCRTSRCPLHTLATNIAPSEGGQNPQNIEVNPI